MLHCQYAAICVVLCCGGFCWNSQSVDSWLLTYWVLRVSLVRLVMRTPVPHCADVAVLMCNNLCCILLQGNLLRWTVCQQLAVDILGAASKSCNACSTFTLCRWRVGQVTTFCSLELAVICAHTASRCIYHAFPTTGKPNSRPGERPILAFS